MSLVFGKFCFDYYTYSFGLGFWLGFGLGLGLGLVLVIGYILKCLREWNIRQASSY